MLQPVGEVVPPHRRRAEPFDGRVVLALRLRQDGFERRSGVLVAGRVGGGRRGECLELVHQVQAGQEPPERREVGMVKSRDRARPGTSIPRAMSRADSRRPRPSSARASCTEPMAGISDHAASATSSRTRPTRSPGSRPSSSVAQRLSTAQSKGEPPGLRDPDLLDEPPRAFPGRCRSLPATRPVTKSRPRSRANRRLESLTSSFGGGWTTSSTHCCQPMLWTT